MRSSAEPVQSLCNRTLDFMIAIGACFPALIYDNYFESLVWVSLALAPLCAVYFVYFFLLRRRRLNLRSLYEGRFRSRYGFGRGFNPVSFVAVVGSHAYFLLMNPITYNRPTSSGSLAP